MNTQAMVDHFTGRRKRRPRGQNRKPKQQVGICANQHFDFLCVLDFEAVWTETGSHKEIIEFPVVILNTRTGKVVGDRPFHRYVKPRFHKELNQVCKDTTGITQQQVDEGLDITEVIPELDRYLTRWIPSGATFSFVTCGDWDLKTMFPIEVRAKKVVSPEYLRRWVNLKIAFASFFGTRPRGMAGMLKYLKMDLQGRHHSGIDDVKNLVRICQTMLNMGFVFQQTGQCQ